MIHMSALLSYESLSMTFSKSEMQEELFTFLNLFGENIALLYGSNDTWAKKEAIQKSPIWEAIGEMYDYGVTGTPKGELSPGGHIYGAYGHAERFLRGMDTPQMKLYLEENGNTLPRLAMFAVQSAVARIVLDGGWRYTDYGDGDMNHLAIAEVALLANMDERSVRNAANPKLPNPLKTKQIGKRSLISLEEARRWLAGRKGYIPTKECEGRVERLPEFNLRLTKEDVENIEREAKKAGLSFMKYFEKAFIHATASFKKEMDK